MSQMQTFMKDLTDLNQAIESTLIPADFDVVQKYMATQASMTTALNGLPAEYARAYLQVQTLKYDEKNDPVDVTAEEALSVPESVISRYRQSWGNLNNTLQSLSSRIQNAEITKVAPVLENRDVVEFEPGFDAVRQDFTPTEYASKVSIFAEGSELDVLMSKLYSIQAQVSSANITIYAVLNALISLVPATVLVANITTESASRRVSAVSLSSKVNGSAILSLIVQTRGRTFTHDFDFSSVGSLTSAFNTVRQQVRNGGTGWTEVTGGQIVGMSIPTSYGPLSAPASITIDAYSGAEVRAYAPGGNSVMSVDKVAIDIDLSHLNSAISSL